MSRIKAGAVFPWAAAFAVALLGFSPLASAQQAQGAYKTATGRQAGQTWGREDKCTRDAVKAYPDHDAASNARREAARQECMVRNGVRYGSAPAATNSGSK